MPGIAWRSVRLRRLLGLRVIFISYRRSDSSDITGRIYDRLALRFGQRRVIKDVNSFPLGVDFRDYIERVVPNCKVLLVIIGPEWLSGSGGQGTRPIDDPFDPVRLELAAALKNDVRVIPVLVGGARMPAREALPEAIRMLASRQGMAIRGDPDFHWDIDRLIADL